ncbi:MAG TPA: hypothetical protein VGG25_31235 [Streptosporangiaceae bacterium]
MTWLDDFIADQLAEPAAEPGQCNRGYEWHRYHEGTPVACSTCLAAAAARSAAIRDDDPEKWRAQRAAYRQRQRQRRAAG